MRLIDALFLTAMLLPLACAHSGEQSASSSASDHQESASDAPVVADADARDKIVGTWHETFESAEAQVSYIGDTTYRADGTFHVDGKMTYQGQPMDAVGDGTYRIQGGDICYTFTSGTGPMEEALGQEVCETLLEVSDTKVRYKDHNDEKVTEMTRVTEASAD